MVVKLFTFNDGFLGKDNEGALTTRFRRKLEQVQASTLIDVHDTRAETQAQLKEKFSTIKSEDTIGIVVPDGKEGFLIQGLRNPEIQEELKRAKAVYIAAPEHLVPCLDNNNCRVFTKRPENLKPFPVDENDLLALISNQDTDVQKVEEAHDSTIFLADTNPAKHFEDYMNFLALMINLTKAA